MKCLICGKESTKVVTFYKKIVCMSCCYALNMLAHKEYVKSIRGTR